jgi:hypothetical protein
VIRPDGSETNGNSVPLDLDKWYHYAVEYYKMIGTKDIEYRLLQNGVVISTIPITGGFGMNKNFYVKRFCRL